MNADTTIRSVSACMATHNGAAYVREQLRTVLAELGALDEVIIVDDASTDATVEIIQSFNDPRVRVISNSTRRGHVRTFERALEAATGEIICLVDQDDIWPAGRIHVLRSALERGDVAAGRFVTFTDDTVGHTATVSNLRDTDSGHSLRNLAGLALGRRDYYGSAMAFTSRMKHLILPIPEFVEAHDHWIAIAGCLFGRLQHVEDFVVLRRIHGSNLSSTHRRPLRLALRTRAIMGTSIAVLLARACAIRSPRARVVQHRHRDQDADADHRDGHPRRPPSDAVERRREGQPEEAGDVAQRRVVRPGDRGGRPAQDVGSPDPRPRACVIYPFIAHYRRSVFQAMHDDSEISFEFASGDTLPDATIRLATPQELPWVRWIANFWLGSILFQPHVVRHALTSSHDVTVLVGDVRFLSSWIGAAILRLRRRRVVFWTIGWHRPERGLKRLVRLAFYGLANALLVYGETGRSIGQRAGYPMDKMYVIGNSHDAPHANSSHTAHKSASEGGLVWVGAVVRANEDKRLDLLVHAVRLLRAGGREVGVLLVGEGPCLPELAALAEDLCVPIRLLGAIHDSEELERVYEELLVTVVPEAAGLTTIQSLWHGRPVVTCEDPYRQMPEFEAVVPGETGSLYRTGDLAELATEVGRWLDRVSADPVAVAERCRQEVEDRWTSRAHAERIRAALLAVIAR